MENTLIFLRSTKNQLVSDFTKVFNTYLFLKGVFCNENWWKHIYRHLFNFMKSQNFFCILKYLLLKIKYMKK